MKRAEFEQEASQILSVISNPFRIKLILTLGLGEACVCHLEAILNNRQAFISQHLMALRKAGILATRREGKYIFYRLADPRTLALIKTAGKLAGMDIEQLPEPTGAESLPSCVCPRCEPLQGMEHVNKSSIPIAQVKGANES